MAARALHAAPSAASSRPPRKEVPECSSYRRGNTLRSQKPHPSQQVKLQNWVLTRRAPVLSETSEFISLPKIQEVVKNSYDNLLETFCTALTLSCLIRKCPEFINYNTQTGEKESVTFTGNVFYNCHRT